MFLLGQTLVGRTWAEFSTLEVLLCGFVLAVKYSKTAKLTVENLAQTTLISRSQVTGESGLFNNIVRPGNTKGGSITVLLTSFFTGSV